MAIYVKMFNSLMKHMISSNVKRTSVVTIKHWWFAARNPKNNQKELAALTRTSRDETRWQSQIDVFSEGVVKKSIVHVKLLNRPSINGCQGEDDSDVAGLTTGEKVSRKVHPFRLCKPLFHQTSFVAVYSAIRKAFDLIHPFVANGFNLRKTIHQPPCLIQTQCFKLIPHSSTPLRVLIGLSKRLRLIFRMQRQDIASMGRKEMREREGEQRPEGTSTEKMMRWMSTERYYRCSLQNEWEDDVDGGCGGWLGGWR
ncbi:hypothetical protein PIB30_073597 [Stylosanthes scabra]|uniref:Uncharacterized protein n=1 Tax=Stylosanthes scabra TaxID=79078 RepID=A0ABU6WPA6_9FABA|nr:hypothetical protein [Stylosanthes scabra]